jgi:ABC-type transport system involved in multi-copper enzyme maturation permease subunit
VSSIALTHETGGALLRRQLLAVMRLELAKGFSLGRSLWLFFLAFAPTFIIGAHALKDKGCSLEEETLILAAMVQLFYVRFAIFFGCLGLSMRLLRGEVAEKTLHYGLLAPLRRERLIVGKFLAGALLATVIFGAGVLASFALMFGHFDAGRDFVLHGPGLGHLRGYLLVTALASLGYSSVFLALSLLFKNPVVPGMVVLLWELINGILPVWLKRFTVTYYLKPLFPVALPLDGIFQGLFTVVAEPMPPWLAVTGLLAFAALVVAFACWRMRRFEISYATD